MADMAMLAIEWISIDRLFLNPSNPRRNDAAVPHVEASIRRFGFQQPVVAKPSGEVIAGNTRLKAATRLKLEKVPVVWFGGSDLDATAYAIADNRTHEFSEWDEPVLARLLQQLRAEDAAQDIAFSNAEIDELLAIFGDGAANAECEDPGPQAPPAQPVSRTGDLWLLGDHQLLCGDSTSEADVLRVMNGSTAALVATDPPYLVDYTGERPNDSGKDWTHDYREVDIKDAEGFFRAVFANVLRVLGPHSAIYCWHAHKRQAVLARVWEELGILDHQQIVWVKPTAVFGRMFWHFRHEPCMMGWRKGNKPEHDGQHDHDSVWEVDWEGKQRVVGNEHPTQKPVELFLRPLRKHTNPGDLVFEPFSGSGSQLIACEQAGRKCRAIEISPAFVDVALRRWEGASRKQARLHATGQTYEQVATERGVPAR